MVTDFSGILQGAGEAGRRQDPGRRRLTGLQDEQKPRQRFACRGFLFS